MITVSRGPVLNRRCDCSSRPQPPVFGDEFFANGTGYAFINLMKARRGKRNKSSFQDIN